MLHISLNYFEATAIAVMLYYIGIWLKNHIRLLRDFFIPEAVIGGLVFAFLKFGLYQLGICKISFDDVLQMFFMSMFFTSVGFAGKASFIRKGGDRLIKLGALVTVLILLQNFLGVVVAKLMGQKALLGIAAGSMPMVGGHGSAGMFGPILETMGVKGAMPSSMAMATFGLIMGGLLGGPLAGRLIEKYKLHGENPNCLARQLETGTTCESNHDELQEHKPEELEIVSTPSKLMRAMALLLICMGIGSVVCDIGKHYNVFLPPYAGGILVAAILRNIESRDSDSLLYIPTREIIVLAEIGLNIFLSMALMSLNLWQLKGLFGPLAAIAIGQMLLMSIFTSLIVFKALEKSYEAAVMVAGICGFGLGAVPTAMANMQSITNRFGPAPLAYLLIPIVGSLADGINATIIVILVNLLK